MRRYRVMLRSLTTGRGENLLTEDNAPERIWQGNRSPWERRRLGCGQGHCRCRPRSGIVRLSLPFDAPYAGFQTRTLLVVSFCCRGAVTDLWSSRIAGRLADT